MDMQELGVLWGSDVGERIYTAFFLSVGIGFLIFLWSQTRIVNRRWLRTTARVSVAAVAVTCFVFVTQSARVRLAGGVLATQGETQEYYRMYVNGGLHQLNTCIIEMSKAADRIVPDLPAAPDGIKELPADYSPDRCLMHEQIGPYQQAVSAWLTKNGQGPLLTLDLGESPAQDVIRVGYMLDDSPAFIGRLIVAGKVSGRTKT